MTAVVVIEGLVILLLAILLGGLLKSHAEILRQLHSLGAAEDGSVTVGTAQTRPKTTGFEKAPSTTLTGIDLEGGTRSISLEHGRSDTLLAFLSSGCLSCETFWKEFGGDFDLPSPNTRTVIVTKGPNAESPSRVRELAPARLPLLMSDDVWDTFKVPMTPYFMLVDGKGMVIGEGAASSWRHLLGLLRQSTDDGASMRRTTGGRNDYTEDHLRTAGLHPGDPTLYENPLGEPEPK
jgi:thioredoxin-related protein